MSTDFDDTLTNLARPRTSAIITVRVIKSFEFRTERSLVLRDINLETTTVGGLKEIARNGQRPRTVLARTLLLKPTSRFSNSDPDSVGMETVSLCAPWSANSSLPSWEVAVMTLFPAPFLFPPA
jgi:hypothetical protein